MCMYEPFCVIFKNKFDLVDHKLVSKKWAVLMVLLSYSNGLHVLGLNRIGENRPKPVSKYTYL